MAHAITKLLCLALGLAWGIGLGADVKRWFATAWRWWRARKGVKQTQKHGAQGLHSVGGGHV